MFVNPSKASGSLKPTHRMLGPFDTIHLDYSKQFQQVFSISYYCIFQQLDCGQGWTFLSGNKCVKLFHGDDKRTYERAQSVCQR